MIEPIKELPIAPSLLQGVQVLTDKVNELVDAVNRQQEHITNVGEAIKVI